MNKILLISSSLLISAATATSVAINHRPYISTRLAKVIVSDSNDIVIQEKCDGSGWITHGDGHKTACPGCSECKSNETGISNETSISKSQECTRQARGRPILDFLRRILK